jgi:YidC/Oxa1 family membrane protein insertase
MRVMRATPWIFPLGVLLGGLFAAFPIAILLYWLSNNLWTLGQQRIVFRRFAAEDAARPVVPVAPAAPEPVAPAPALRPGAKPVAARPAPARRPTSAGARTGGKAAAGRRNPARRR